MDWRLCPFNNSGSFYGILPFCGPSVIDHFLCDLNPLLKLVYMDTHTLGLFVAANSGFICLLNVLFLMVSYVVVLYSLRTYSLEGHAQPSLPVCPVVILFFMPWIFVYLSPGHSFSIDKAVAVIYTIITPIVNF